jgi:hypothetical protein
MIGGTIGAGGMTGTGVITAMGAIAAGATDGTPAANVADGTMTAAAIDANRLPHLLGLRLPGACLLAAAISR